MSVRARNPQTPANNVHTVIQDIESYQRANTLSEVADASACSIEADALAGLTETERMVAKLGVSADEWKPISFMNNEHYNTLLKNNALAGSLAQKLEAYKQVANSD
jgi:hypothetical protein